MLLSFVIPCYRSRDTLDGVLDEIIQKVSERPKYDYEIITVNDCSPDDVMQVIRRRASENPRIKGLDLSINGGKHAAILAGYRVVSGDYVIGVDDDGQCPIDHLWELIEPLEQGHDMAMAQYIRKEESGLKRFGSKVNAWMSYTLLDKPKNLVFSNFIARKRFVCDAMSRYPNPYPYLEGLSLKVTRDIVTVSMAERSRVSGVSGYTFKKSLQLWLNGFTAFSVKPLRIATIMGALIASFGVIFGIYTIINKIIHPSILVGYSSTMVVLLFIGGMLMLMLGIIGEYIGRIYICINRLPQYVVREKINIEKE